MNLNAALEVLGVTSTSDEKTVRRAYAKLAKTYRPDTHPEEFSRVREAYDCVMETFQTSGYDELNVASVVAAASEVNIKDIGDELEAQQRVVAYVVNADQLGSTEDDVPEVNPLQYVEDEVVSAVKATSPGDALYENHVALLIDDYLTAASRVSYGLRDYVERFVIGLCLGDYYLPHVVREKAADLCGLSNAVVSEERLKPWEQEFLRRFDESAVVEDILVKAAQKGQAENAVLNNVSWPKVFMLRLNETEANKANQYIHWFDYTFGQNEGYVNDAFRYRWQKLRQIQPLNAVTVLVFTVFMALSGMALHKLGVPLHRFFQMPIASMAFMAAGLAVLSWANFLLVVLARPVVAHYQSRLRDVLNRRFAKALVVIETLLLLGLIWFAVLVGAGVGEPAFVSVGVCLLGMLVLAVALLSRHWGFVQGLSFFRILMLLGGGYLVSILLKQMLAVPSAGNALWLVIGLAVTVLPNRAVVIRADGGAEARSGSGSALSDLRVWVRGFEQNFPLSWVRVGMTVVAAACTLGFAALYHVLDGAPDWPRPVMTGLLLSVLALELSLNGPVSREDTAARRTRSKVFDVALLLGAASILLGEFVHPAVVIPMVLGCYLAFCGEWYMSAKRFGEK